VTRSLFIPTLAGFFCCLVCLPVQATEYCLRPGKQDGTQANSVVCCTTPNGWQGWKDDPHYRDRINRLDAYSKGFLRRLVSFHQPNCKKGPECPYLGLDARGRDSHCQPDVEAGLRDFLNELEQPQDLSPRHRPCVVVSRFGSFHTENSGALTIWQIRCPSGSEHFVALLAQRDVLVTIDLGGSDIKDIVPKLDSLKELARSVRITDASLALPDIVEINVDHLSDAEMRQQLLQLTPVGTPMEKVYEVLQSHLYKEVHRSNGDLWIEIGSYASAVSRRKPPPKEFRPPTSEEIRQHISDSPTLPLAIVVHAFWRSDKQHKLRAIEIRRQVIKHELKRALPAK
jgi:hypothetical protein